MPGFRSTGIEPFQRNFVQLHQEDLFGSVPFAQYDKTQASTAQPGVEEALKYAHITGAPSIAQKLLAHDGLIEGMSRYAADQSTHDASAVRATMEEALNHLCILGDSFPTLKKRPSTASRPPATNAIGELTSQSKILNTIDRIDKLQQVVQERKAAATTSSETRRTKTEQCIHELRIAKLCYQHGLIRWDPKDHIELIKKPRLVSLPNLVKLAQLLDAMTAIKSQCGVQRVSDLERSDMVNFFLHTIDQEGNFSVSRSVEPATEAVEENSPNGDAVRSASEDSKFMDDSDEDASSNFVTMRDLVQQLSKWSISQRRPPRALNENVLQWRTAVKWDTETGWYIGTIVEMENDAGIYWVQFDGFADLYKVELKQSRHVETQTCSREPPVKAFFFLNY